MERVCTYICIALGVFCLIMSFYDASKYLITSGICFGAAIMTTETREH